MNRDKRKPDEDMSDLGLEEALVRLMQTDPEELAAEIEAVKNKNREVEEYVEERRDSIRRGAFRTKHRFRL